MQFNKILNLLDDIYTTMPNKEKEVLFKEALKVPDGGYIVDIGTCDGNSAFIMSLANPKTQLWTIDPKPGKLFLEKRHKLKLMSRVHFIEDTSDNAVLDWFDPIDLLFIDGLHTVDGIKNDINNWGKFVKEGGTVILHDYFWYEDYVQKAIDSADVKLQIIDIPFGHYDGKKVGIAITKKI